MKFITQRFKKKKAGTQPVGLTAVVYSPDPTRETLQDKWTWPWAPGVTQYGARVTNTWWGNQLPSELAYIPLVRQSYSYWNVPRTVLNNPNWAVQYNKSFNIQGQGAVSSAVLQQQIMQAWQNRMG